MSPDIPISVAELHRRLLPYPLCRDRLGYASKAEYDVDLLRLLCDTRTVQVPETALREAAQTELNSPEPGLALLQRFAASEIRMLRFRGGEAGGSRETGPPVAALETSKGRGDVIPGLDDPLFVPRDEAADALGYGDDVEPAESGAGEPREPCRSCGEHLPARAGVRFCPRCGADQMSWPCPACGEEVERGWSYCASCGKMLPTS